MLADLANFSTIVLALAAVLAFVASIRVVTAALLARIYVGELLRATCASPRKRYQLWPRTYRAYFAALNRRLTGEPWKIADETDLIRSIFPEWRHGVVWEESAPTVHIAQAYTRSLARIGRSIPLRLGASVVIAEERARCRQLSLLLQQWGTFTVSGDNFSTRPIAQIEDQLGSIIAVGPPEYGVKRYLDETYCTLAPSLFGVATLPFADLAQAGEDALEAEWGDAPPGLADLLTKRAVAAARNRLADPLRRRDFNGGLVRLVKWRVEFSDISLDGRLHLQLERTNFASLLATNGGLNLGPVGGLELSTLRELCLDHHLDTPEQSYAANALAVHLVILSADGYLVLVKRSSGSEWAPDRINTAVNGLVEISPRNGLAFGDFDEGGFVSVAAAAVREAHEEIGVHLALRQEQLVTRGLVVDVAPDEQVTPYVVMEARVQLPFADIASGHFYGASRAEGAFEVAEFIGLRISAETVRECVAWVRANMAILSRPGAITTLLTLMHFAAPEEINEAWFGPAPPCEADVARIATMM